MIHYLDTYREERLIYEDRLRQAALERLAYQTGTNVFTDLLNFVRSYFKTR